MGGTWIDVCDEAFVPPGTMRCIAVSDHRILIALTSEGQWFAADEMCTHEDASLCLGALRDSRVKCPLHGSWFDLRDGSVDDEPATEPLKTYPIRAQSGRIEVLI